MIIVRQKNDATTFVKLTLKEVRLIVRFSLIAFTKTTDPTDVRLIANIIESLLRKHDFVENRLYEFVQMMKRHFIEVDPCLLVPNGSREIYRGLDENQRHLLRQFKHARIIREEIADLGADFTNLDLTYLHTIPVEPTESIEEILRINREAERVKRKTQRDQYRVDESAAKAALVTETFRDRVGRQTVYVQTARKLAEARRVISNLQAENDRLRSQMVQT